MRYVIGAKGFLGAAFLRRLKSLQSPVIGTHHSDSQGFNVFDLASPQIGQWKGTSAIVAAGVTNIRKCELEKEACRQKNVEGTLNLVDQLLHKGIKPILFSSDYVFDGEKGNYDEESKLNPLNEYGRQKAELETRLEKEYRGKYLLIRLSKVYGLEKGDGSLIDEMIQNFMRGQKIKAAVDQIFCPVFVEDVVDLVLQLDELDATGVFQIAGNERISRYDLARAVCKIGNYPANLIEPIVLRDLNEPFLRPCQTDMKNQKSLKTTGMKMTNLEFAIQQLVEQYI